MKIIATAVSLISGTAFIAQADGVASLNLPTTGTGWVAVITTIVLAVMVLMDKRKIAAADTSKAIIEEKDKLIENLRQMIEHHQAQIDKWEEDASKVQEELDKYRKMHHDYRNEATPEILRLSTENAALKVLLSNNGISIPLKS